MTSKFALMFNYDESCHRYNKNYQWSTKKYATLCDV